MAETLEPDEVDDFLERTTMMRVLAYVSRLFLSLLPSFGPGNASKATPEKLRRQKKAWLESQVARHVRPLGAPESSR